MSGVHTRQVVDVNRGLFLVRYASAEDRACPPVIRVSPGDNPDIRLVVHPDESDAVMRSPGACIVLRAEAEGQLAIDIAPARRSGSVAAKVTIEALNPEAPPRLAMQGRRAAARPRGELEVTGHVAGQGDVTVKAGQWLAGPNMPARIEGLQMVWPGMPEDLAIRYAVKTARPSAGSDSFSDIGAFAGSRGKALPIVAVVLDISGQAASRFKVSADMIFLGAPILRSSGLRISGAGPTGREPLVGFRFAVEEQVGRRPAIPAARVTPRSPSPKRVRVFRSDEPSLEVSA